MNLYDRVVLEVRVRRFQIRFIGRRENDGEYNWEGLISLSIYAPHPVSVLIHETLHRLYPFKKEKWVLKHEARIYSRLTPEDRKYLSGVVKRARAEYRRNHL